jgi:hypothetical protein
VWEECHQRSVEASEVFRTYLERLMEENGISGIEELHERFLETGWRIPIPGRHADKPVPFEEFKLHCARAWPSPESPWTYASFMRGVWEVLDLDKDEQLEFVRYYVLGSLD